MPLEKITTQNTHTSSHLQRQINWISLNPNPLARFARSNRSTFKRLPPLWIAAARWKDSSWKKGLSMDSSFRKCLVLTFSVSALSSGYFVSKCETRVHNPHGCDIKRAETDPYAAGMCASSPVILRDVFVSCVLERVRVDFTSNRNVFKG